MRRNRTSIQDRPPKPKAPRGISGVRPVWSSQRWRWRAVCEVDGRRLVGTLRDDRETAHDDYLALRKTRTRVPRELRTFEEGLAAALAALRRRGARECTQVCYEVMARALLRAFSGDAALDQVLTADQINWYIEASLAAGRSANTIATKDLWLLRRVASLAQIPWPDGVRKVRWRRQAMPFFEPAELVELMARIRSITHDADGRRVRTNQREWVASLVEILACTGLRNGELARLTVDDVDLVRLILRVKNHKAGTVDQIRIAANLVPRFELLVNQARAAGRTYLLGGPEERNRSARLTRALTHWSRLLGDDRLHGRALRHSHVTMALIDTGDLRVAQESGRHASIQMTSRYLHVVNQARNQKLRALEARFGGGGGLPEPARTQGSGPT